MNYYVFETELSLADIIQDISDNRVKGVGVRKQNSGVIQITDGDVLAEIYEETLEIDEIVEINIIISVDDRVNPHTLFDKLESYYHAPVNVYG